MTSAEDCLLAAVLSARDNDLPRLIYADWLEENERAERAELIRVQCKLARLDCPNCGGKGLYANVGKGWMSCFRCPAYDLRKRERELLYGSARWLPAGVVSSHVEGPVRPDPDGEPVGVWGRGFVEEVVCTAGDWLAHADAIYWRPGLRCEPCDGSGDKASHHPDGNLQFLGPCEDCNGAGAVPCPPTAHPVRRVRLTTQPEFANRLTMGFRSPGPGPVPPGAWFEASFEVDGWGKVTQRCEPDGAGFTCDRWPGVEFELPPERPLEQALRDDPPTPGERAVYDGTWFAPRFGRGLPPDLT